MRLSSLFLWGLYIRLEREKHLFFSKPLKEIGISELNPKQAEKLCEISEKTVRKHLLSKVPIKNISDIDITIDIEWSKPIIVNVDLQITLSYIMKDYDVQKMTNEAIEKAFLAIEKYLREISCKSKK